MELKLYVGNLPYSTTEKDLRRLFAKAGGVDSVELIKDGQTGQSKGFAFITMSTRAEAQKAAGMFNGYAIADRKLNVKPATAKTQEAPSGYSSKLGAFGPSDQRTNTGKPKGTRGGYQSSLSAFGNGAPPGKPSRKTSSRRK